ncbi:hypothetical protein [Kribbella sp. HUAS MG21]|jgi:hypothetical protein|uniref:HNH endonuclease n=1 Tax=Kribbella sp. HUAS MG21 TaxID=3160966 RepID=A0AAU7TL60_9ACTN
MTAGTAHPFAVEWGGEPTEPKPSGLDWPTLRPSERCDGKNPMTGHACIKGHHKGYHRDATGAEWLDD